MDFQPIERTGLDVTPEAIEVRCDARRIPVRRQVIGAERVDRDDDERRAAMAGRRGPGTGGREQRGEAEGEDSGIPHLV